MGVDLEEMAGKLSLAKRPAEITARQVARWLESHADRYRPYAKSFGCGACGHSSGGVEVGAHAIARVMAEIISRHEKRGAGALA